MMGVGHLSMPLSPANGLSYDDRLLMLSDFIQSLGTPVNNNHATDNPLIPCSCHVN